MVLTQRVNTPLFGEAQMFSEQVSTAGIRKAVMDGRKMRVLPLAEWMKFSWAEIRTLLHETATYVVPTEELIDYLDELIGDEKAIEICAGNGYIGSNLDIMMTDSYQQQDDNSNDVRPYEATTHQISQLGAKDGSKSCGAPHEAAYRYRMLCHT